MFQKIIILWYHYKLLGCTNKSEKYWELFSDINIYYTYITACLTTRRVSMYRSNTILMNDYDSISKMACIGNWDYL